MLHCINTSSTAYPIRFSAGSSASKHLKVTGVELSRNSGTFDTCMEVSGQVPAPTALPPG